MRMCRHDYLSKGYKLDQLKSRLRATEDRATRADTMEASLADHYDMQELQAAIQLKEAETAHWPF
jgi:hypothetical protein